MAAFSSSVNSTSSRTKPFGAFDFGFNQLKIFTVFSLVSCHGTHPFYQSSFRADLNVVCAP